MCDAFECGVSRGSRIRFGASFCFGNVNALNDDGGEPQRTRLLGRALGNISRARLQCVIDDDGPGSNAALRCLKAERRRQPE